MRNMDTRNKVRLFTTVFLIEAVVLIFLFNQRKIILSSIIIIFFILDMMLTHYVLMQKKAEGVFEVSALPNLLMQKLGKNWILAMLPLSAVIFMAMVKYVPSIMQVFIAGIQTMVVINNFNIALQIENKDTNQRTVKDIKEMLFFEEELEIDWVNWRR
jgi:hypothetical protein